MNRAKVVTGLALVAATLGAVGALYLYGNAEDEEEEEKEDEECPTTSALSKGRGAPKPAPDQAVGVVEKARALREAGKLDEAEALLTRALALADASNPAGREGGTVGLASLLSALASLKLAAGHPEEAEPLLARTVPILGALLGFEHPSMATTLNNLASAQLSQNKYADAEANYRAAFAICAAHFGPDHVESATALGNLAVVLQDKGEFDQAEALFVKALAAKCSAEGYGDGHPSTQATARALAACRALQLRGRVKLVVSGGDDATGYGGGREVNKADVAWAPPAVRVPPSAAADKGSDNNGSGVVDFDDDAVVSVDDAGFDADASDDADNSGDSGGVAGPLKLAVAAAEPLDAAGSLANGAGLAGKAALVKRGGCSFGDKVDRCEAAGALAVLVMNNDEDKPDHCFTMGCNPNYACGIPVVMVSLADGNELLAAAAAADAASVDGPEVEFAVA